MRLRIFERRVRKPKAEGKLRAVLLVDITRNILFQRISWRMRQIITVGRTASVESIVINRNLSNSPGPTDDQLSTRWNIAEKYAHQRRAGLNSGEPACDDRGHMFKCPGKRQRPSAEKQQHHWLSRGGHFLQQFLLPSGQVEVCAGSRLSRLLPGFLAQRNDHHIRWLSHFNRFLYFPVAGCLNLSTLGIPDFSAAGSLFQCRFKRYYIFWPSPPRP